MTTVKMMEQMKWKKFLQIYSLLQLMINPVAKDRPSATALTQHPVLCPLAAKSKVS